MKVISSTNDGFVISEKDLELPEFKIANLFEDVGMLKQVQGIALEIIDKDPLLEKEENKLLKKLVDDKFKDRIEI